VCVCVRCARCVPTERRMRLCFGTQKQSGSVRGTKKVSLSLRSPRLPAVFQAVRAQFLHDNHHLQLPVEFICGMRGGSLRIHHVALRGIAQSGHVSMDQQNQSCCDLKSSLCGSRCGTTDSLDDSPISHVSVISAIVTQLFYRRSLIGKPSANFPTATCEQTLHLLRHPLFVELRNTLLRVGFWVKTLRPSHFGNQGRFLQRNAFIF
jgi:hypothetical protein